MTCKHQLIFVNKQKQQRIVCRFFNMSVEPERCTNCPNREAKPPRIIATALENETTQNPTTPHAAEELPDGPGTRLHNAILKYLGESAEDDCDCMAYVYIMNAMGYERCVLEIDTIVGWLHKAAIKRGWKMAKLPLAKYVIKQFILHAIKE